MSLTFTNRTRLLGTPFSATVANWMTRGFLKTITPVVISLAGNASATQTLSPAVDPANCLLLYAGNANAEVDNPAVALTYVTLTNSTTITAVRNTGASNVAVRGVLLELKPGFIKRVQRGTATFTAATTKTVTITAVTTGQTILNVPGWLSPNTTFSGANDVISGVLTNSTTITFTRTGSTGLLIVSYEVVEFY